MENKTLAELLVEIVNEGYEISFYKGFIPGSITFRMEKDGCKSAYTFSEDLLGCYRGSLDALISHRIIERRNDFLEYINTHGHNV